MVSEKEYWLKMKFSSQTTFFRNLILTVFAFVIIYAGVYYYLGAKLSSYILLWSSVPLTALTFYLERKKQEVISRLLFVASCVLYIYATPMGIRLRTNYEYYYLPAMMIPLLLFETNQSKKILLSMLMPLAAWVLSAAEFFPQIPLQWQATHFPDHIFRPVNFLGAFLITGLFIRYYANYLERVKAQALKNLTALNQELLQAEAELKERKAFLEAVLNNIPSIIFVKSFENDLSYSHLNKAGEDLLGITENEILGKNDYDLFSKEQANYFRETDRAAFEKKNVLKIENEEIYVKGEKKNLTTYKVPTYDEGGNPHLLIGISNDITQELLVKNALEIERMKSIQNAKMATLGEMAAGIAHEINNPLATISGTTLLLPSIMDEPEKMKMNIAAIQRSTDRIAKIVSGLKKFSRSADKSEYRYYSISEIVRESVDLTAAYSKKFFVQVRVDELIDAKIYCDEIEIEQVLINLINNSVDAVADLEEKWVSVSVSENKNEVIIRVSDSGPGISTDILDKIFLPFFTTKPVGRGTGLGLSVVKGILDEHKATIAILTKEKNTCFEIRFRKNNLQFE